MSSSSPSNIPGVPGYLSPTATSDPVSEIHAAAVKDPKTGPRTRTKRRRVLYHSSMNASQTTPTCNSDLASRPVSKDIALARELTLILTSSTAVANPFHALVQAIAYHRAHTQHSSVKTFNLLLAFAVRTRNYYGLRRILRDMQRGNVAWDDGTKTLVLKAVLQSPGARDVNLDIMDKPANGQPIPLNANNRAMDRQTDTSSSPKGKIDGRIGLIHRLEAMPPAVADGYRQAVLNAGRWTHQKLPVNNHLTPSSSTPAPSLDSPPARRLSVLQNALAPDKARSLLPPDDVQLSPSLFLAFLRYILACSPHTPSLADSYTALIALDTPKTRVTSADILHLVHLYLHPSMYTYQRPFHVITQMRSLTQGTPWEFKPTSETLQKALLGLRLRWARARAGMTLVRLFHGVWGGSIVDLACWRILGKYGLERADRRVQAYALKGGMAAYDRERLHKAAKRRQESHRPEGDLDGKHVDPSASATISLVDPFLRQGLERQKWTKVRKAIQRNQRDGAARLSADEGKEKESLSTETAASVLHQ
ncbi:hypothetical protein QFC19_003315 [Naganishia cerealis]|uniref:Uncharacterized protein n=1 Tax=Naganishia cerealis TaxID=610337 RepID=A0ACC2W3T9_9TREE|nr:hypothetical protein QFC19_003315 [Naganishia cerealis]